MSKVFMLAKREYLAAVRTKTFIIMLVVMPIFMGGSGIGMALFKDRVDTDDLKIAVIDESGLVTRALIEAAEARNAEAVHEEETGKKIRPAYVFEKVDPAADRPSQDLDLSNRVRSGDLHAFMVIGPNVLHPEQGEGSARITYHAEAAVLDAVRGWMGWPLNNHLRRSRAIDAGVTEEQLSDLFNWVDIEGLGLVSVDEATGDITEATRSNEQQAILVPIVMVMLMFMMFMMSAMPQLSAVMEEKQQRIAEVMLGSVRPFDFMMGKVLGGVAVSLTCISVYVIGGIVTLKKMNLEHYIPYDTLPWFLAYLILAIIMFGSIFAALGSACNDAKEAQSLTFPAMLPMMLPMFLLGILLEQPQSSIATLLSLIPTCTPMAMTLRLASPVSVPAWQPWLGLALVVLTTAVTVWAGGRIFRVAILMQGTPPKPANLVKWMIRG